MANRNVKSVTLFYTTALKTINTLSETGSDYAKFKCEPFDPCPPYKWDDFNFFERCRRLNIKCWCAPHIEAKHLALREYGSEDYNPHQFEPATSILKEVRI